MERTPEGKVKVYRKGGFARPNGLDPLPSRDFWPVDARQHVGNAPTEYSYTPFTEDGTAPADDGKLPPSPHLSKTVPVPLNPAVAKSGVTVEELKAAGVTSLADGVPLIPSGAGIPNKSTLKAAK